MSQPLFSDTLMFFSKIHGLLHLLGFDHEIGEEAEKEMEEEEELLLKSLGWKGKGLIQSAYEIEKIAKPQSEKSDGKFPLFICIILHFLFFKGVL